MGVRHGRGYDFRNRPYLRIDASLQAVFEIDVDSAREYRQDKKQYAAVQQREAPAYW
jgi:Na+-transporting NADH:ubiquinone oxidoreductase subunit NqrF